MIFTLLALALTVTAENQKPGSPDWEITAPALEREIEGYASKTSVNGGDAISLFVSTVDPEYAVDIFRTGWYGGDGARRVAGPFVHAGIRQDPPVMDGKTGLIECRWRDPLILTTADGDGPWTSGVYLARLTAHPSGKQSFIVFVVRDDGRAAAIGLQTSVATYQAYNNWGGRSLYAFNSGDAPARVVSFDRPYAMNPYGIRLDGAGEYLRRWEYNVVRWLEREGYDVSYSTDVDTHERPESVTRHRVFMVVGHDAFWSWQMRRTVERARDDGVHLVFIAANTCFWQARFSSDGRQLIAYKEAAATEDPLALDRDPTNDRFVTTRWRDRPVSRPEERLVGVMYATDPVKGDIVVDDATHWAFGGTGLKRGDALRGLLGDEVDAIFGDGPRDIVRLAHSPYRNDGGSGFADMTIYTAPGGAMVFATGSMRWAWGLDGYNAPAVHAMRVNAAAARITRNVIDRMLATRPQPVPPSSVWPSVVVYAVALTLGILTGLASLRRDRPR